VTDFDRADAAGALDESPACSVPAPERGLAWYVVSTKPRREAWAELTLRRKSIEVFSPQLELPRWSPRAGRVIPLFPGYLFVHIDLARRFHDVAWSPGVSRFVGANGTPATLDDEVVAFLQRRATPDGRLRARSALVAGQEIEIVSGPFAGLAGIIQHPPDSQGRIRVLMRLLRRPVSVQIPVRFVKTGWVV
jgi:transcriptional antiterminator RfaH